MIWSDLACIIKTRIHLALFIDNNDNDMTFWGNIVYLCPCSVFAALALRARTANDTTRAQINNIPSKSHVIPFISKFLAQDNDFPAFWLVP